VRFFGTGLVTGGEPEPGEVGNKAANLIRLSRLGLPVPPGFVLGTGLCRGYFERGGRLPEGFRERLAVELRQLENATGSFFGSVRRPLLLAVRSGAPVSMPGMMETVLDVGVNDAVVQGLIRRTGNPRLAWDCYRRLVESYGEVVLGCPAPGFEEIVERAVRAAGVDGVHELEASALERVTAEALERLRAASGEPFPQDPWAQLEGAVEAVLRSWRSDRARAYRRAHGLGDELGTAVTVQAMVFGNAGATSGSGVGFTRDPSTGADELYLDFAFNAQGEDVVSGRQALADARSLARLLPGVEAELRRVKTVLEGELGDLQDFEFTVQAGQLYLLQTRAGKRTPWAALRIAVDLVKEGVIDPETALERLADLDLGRLERRRLADADRQPLACATGAGVGVAVGRVALDPGRAVEMAGAGAPVILVRRDTSTADYEGMAAAEGILTRVGGRTSHAAVVARQLGKVCLVGCRELELDDRHRRCRIAGRDLTEGDQLSLDGDGGRVYAGAVPVVRERPEEALAEVERWRSAVAG
jgi:pyruvate,orthophosphate dikinase